MTKIAILGGTGYTAAELIKILLRHPHAQIVAVTSRDEAMPGVADSHPSLAGRINLRMEPFDADKLVAKGVECVFGCLPHGASMDAIAAFLPPSPPTPLPRRGEGGSVRVIDLSADYRLRDPNVYAQWYGESHHDLANLAHAVYGLPEIYGDDIKNATLIANPGCYPQTGILGLAPLVAGKYVGLKDIIIDSKSGVSGGGRTPKLNFHFPECNESVVAYSVGQHRHTPEIEQALSDIAGEPVEVLFTPHLIPMDRGIFTTIYATPHRSFTDAQLLELYREYYRNAPFVRVTKQVPATKDSVHTNYIDITVRAVRGRIVVLVAEDNLVRGASGVAVQNFNRMFGYEETTAL
ncbi:MAG: N-acetyl-gamma-glutamyl-phosphate reductase [Planctomycetes bacterium]|nr:N-acetyl-gamma-glutamyl-phosphate reductase [Planctomycetota bacterium]